MKATALGKLVLVAVLCGVGAGVAVYMQGSSSPPVQRGVMLPTLQARINDVAVVEIERGGTTSRLVRGEHGFGLESRAGFPARIETLRPVLVGLSTMRIVEPKTADSAKHALLDLAPPAAGSEATRIRLVDGSGAVLASVIVGKTDATGMRSFVRRDAENQSYLVDERIAMPTEELGWIDKSIVQVARDRVRSVEIAHSDGEVLLIQRANEEARDFELASMPAERRTKPAAVVGATGGALAFLSLEDVLPDVGHGLDLPHDPIRVTFETFDEYAVEVEAFSVGEATWVRVRASAEPGSGSGDPARGEARAGEINRRTQGWLFRVSEHTAGLLRRRLEDVLEPAGSRPSDPAPMPQLPPGLDPSMLPPGLRPPG